MLKKSFNYLALLLTLMMISAFPASALGHTESEAESELRKNTGNISGVVTDESGATLPGAVLLLDRDNRYTISNSDGTYVFLGVPAGTYTISIKYLGFEDYSAQVTVTQGKNTHLDVQLKESTFMTGEVIIIGEYAKGQARALNTERSNTNITNMVASDQVGRFPDSNIGDALKRIPGITMQNDQGEARNIVVRGLASNLNSVTLNGGRIPSAEGDNRNVQMDLIPSDMIQLIEVNKTLLPDMEADAIGGSVNLITKSAPRRQIITAKLGGGYNMIRNSGTIDFGFTYGNRFFDNKLGAMLSLSYQNKDYGSDNIEAAWVQKDGQIFMEDFQIRKYDVQRLRHSASLNLDYEFNDSHSIYLNTLYNWRDDRENRFRARMNKMKPIGNGLYEGRIDRQTKGGSDDPRNKNRRLERQEVFDIALGGEHLLGSSIEMDWGGTFSRASEFRPEERYINFRAKDITAGQDLSDGVFPKLLNPSVQIGDFKLDTLSESEQMTYENEWGAKLNFRLPLSVVQGQKGRLRFGAKLRFKEKDRTNNYFEYEPLGDFPSFINIEKDIFDSDKFLNGKGYEPGTFASHTYLGGLDLNNSSLFEREDVIEEYWTNNYHANENIYAAFLRWDQNITEDFLLIAGLRMEHTDIQYVGRTLIDENKGPNIEDGHKYTNFFPNLTMRYQPTDKLVLRMAYSTSIARPNYYWLVPFMNISSSDQKIRAGNADLNSTYAHNFDVIGSYYPGNVGSLSVGLFYKHLNDFIYAYSTNTFTRENFASEFTSINNPIPADENWEYSTYRNGDNVHLFGAELSFNRQLDFLPSQFLRRFSIYLNYTYTHSVAEGITNEDGEVREGMSLPGSAPHTGNASLAYEDKKFTARLSFNFASSYIDELGAEAFEDAYYGAQTFLDFNCNYKIKDNLQIYLDANNLLNTPLYYYQGEKDRLMQFEIYKPVLSAGIRWNL